MARFEASIKFKDAFDGQTRRSYTVDASDHAAASLAFAGWVAAVAAVTDVGVLNYRVFEDVDVATVIVAGSNIDQGLTLQWELAPLLSDKKASINLPGPQMSVFLADRSVDLTDPLIVELRTQLLLGNVRISDHEVVVDLLKGKLDK